MFAVFRGGLKDMAPSAMLEVIANLEEVRSHAHTHDMSGDQFAPVC
jgi:hypothetical protein